MRRSNMFLTDNAASQIHHQNLDLTIQDTGASYGLTGHQMEEHAKKKSVDLSLPLQIHLSIL
jgi:hypothetical protein